MSLCADGDGDGGRHTDVSSCPAFRQQTHPHAGSCNLEQPGSLRAGPPSAFISSFVFCSFCFLGNEPGEKLHCNSPRGARRHGLPPRLPRALPGGMIWHRKEAQPTKWGLIMAFCCFEMSVPSQVSTQTAGVSSQPLTGRGARRPARARTLHRFPLFSSDLHSSLRGNISTIGGA